VHWHKARYGFLDLEIEVENRCEIVELKSSGDEHRHQFTRIILAGLKQKPKQLPYTYHYDQEGRRLFQKISELDEYYLTSCEREIFLNHHHEIAAMLCDEAMYIFKLGVGDGHKAMILLEHFFPRERSSDTYR
jgi:L-histidine Nalpha-methyltransferase